MGKVTRIPIKYAERKKNIMGEGYVSCQVSGRYLSFHKESTELQGGEFISVDIMTEDTSNGEPKKICQMVITREDLMAVLKSIKPTQ